MVFLESIQKMLLNFFNDIEKHMPKLDAKKVMDLQNRVVGRKVDQNNLHLWYNR